MQKRNDGYIWGVSRVGWPSGLWDGKGESSPMAYLGHGVMEGLTGTYFIPDCSRFQNETPKTSGLSSTCRHSNKFIRMIPFRMVITGHLGLHLHEGDWLGANPRFRRFLAFVEEDVAYQFPQLPFGLSMAPKDIHQDDKGDSYQTGRTGRLGINVPRRLVDPSTLGRGVTYPSAHCGPDGGGDEFPNT